MFLYLPTTTRSDSVTDKDKENSVRITVDQDTENDK